MKDEGVTLLGTGLMGTAMAGRLLAEGWPLVVWNRHVERTLPLQEQGARFLPLAAAVAAAPVLLCTLSDAAALLACLDALPAGAMQGKDLVQMSTIAPEQSRFVAERVRLAGGRYLEAPVLGSTPEAGSGRLLVLTAGPEALGERLLPLLSCLGQVRHIGAVGQAAALKLALNQLITGLTASFSLSLGLVREQGIRVEDFMAILRASALYAPTFDKKLSRYLADDYGHPNFPERHLLKDMRLFAEATAGLPLDSRLPALWVTLLEELLAEAGDADYAVLYRALHRRYGSGVEEGAPPAS